MKCTLIALSVVLIGLMSVGGSPRSAEAATCSYTLGFKSLYALMPATVGSCLVDEHHNATNGDGLQETSGVAGGAGSGLLVWRKADNWTAYTDGYHTWINGPNGLQERLNTELLPWEAGYVAPQAPAEDLAYLNARLPTVTSSQKALEGIVAQSNLVANDPSLILDSDWKVTSAVYLAMLQTTGKSFQTYNGAVPPDMAEIDRLFGTLGRQEVTFVNDYATGVDTLDMTYIYRATSELQSATGTVQQITSKLAALKSKYGVAP